ncbi:hypothetical protein KKA02_04785, partial [Patescibacteria group bacterium]|nr:hypothetical protein [Patescibacteria group bacterium]
RVQMARNFKPAGPRAIERKPGERPIFEAVKRRRVQMARNFKPAGPRAIDRSKGRQILKFKR